MVAFFQFCLHLVKSRQMSERQAGRLRPEQTMRRKCR